MTPDNNIYLQHVVSISEAAALLSYFIHHVSSSGSVMTCYCSLVLLNLLQDLEQMAALWDQIKTINMDMFRI